MQTFNIFVTGAHTTGKTQFFQKLQEVEDNLSVSHSTYGGALEQQKIDSPFERTSIFIHDNLIVDIFKLYDDLFVQEYIIEPKMSCLGYIVLIDSCRPVQFVETVRLLQQFTMLTNAPFIVAATKQDDPAAIPLSYIRERLDLSLEIPLVPCTTTDLDSVKQVLISLLEHIEQQTYETFL